MQVELKYGKRKVVDLNLGKILSSYNLDIWYNV